MEGNKDPKKCYAVRYLILEGECYYLIDQYIITYEEAQRMWNQAHYYNSFLPKPIFRVEVKMNRGGN